MEFWQECTPWTLDKTWQDPACQVERSRHVLMTYSHKSKVWSLLLFLVVLYVVALVFRETLGREKKDRATMSHVPRNAPRNTPQSEDMRTIRECSHSGQTFVMIYLSCMIIIYHDCLDIVFALAHSLQENIFELFRNEPR